MNEELFYDIFTIAAIAWFAYGRLQLVRIRAVYKKYDKVFKAVLNYQLDITSNGEIPKVTLLDLTSFQLILDDIAIWRMDQLLPKEKFELIKPYLKK